MIPIDDSMSCYASLSWHLVDLLFVERTWFGFELVGFGCGLFRVASSAMSKGFKLFRVQNEMWYEMVS